MKTEIQLSSFGEVVLNGYKWSPTDDSLLIGTVVIAHGMAEVIERYDDFAAFLNDQGYVVYGLNQRGHGPNTTVYGYLGDDGWEKLKEDYRHLVEHAKNEYTDLPLFAFGHSMGSFVVRYFLRDYNYLVQGVILSGTGSFSKPILKLGALLSAADVKKHGDKHASAFIDKIVFGKNNKKIKAPITEFDWLSRDGVQVKKYIDNPHCGNIHPSSFFKQFFTGLEQIIYNPQAVNFKENCPMFMLSGDADPVGNYGKGVKKAMQYYKENGFIVKIKLYASGRHEMLNEVNREEVFHDIASWLKAQI
jgi:alpha-beta hydrolase superfamily lysophospholipase